MLVLSAGRMSRVTNVAYHIRFLPILRIQSDDESEGLIPIAITFFDRGSGAPPVICHAEDTMSDASVQVHHAEPPNPISLLRFDCVGIKTQRALWF